MPPIIINIPSTPSSIKIPACPHGLERFLVIDGIKWDIVAELSVSNFKIISKLLASSPYSTTLDEIEKSIKKLVAKYNKSSLYDVIKEINTRNSTHLSKVAMNEITEIILKRCPTLADLRIELLKPLTRTSTNNLFYDLCAKIDGKINVSFASKFYFYANKFLNNYVDFSKYDRVVAEKVSIYEKIYCGITVSNNYVIKCDNVQDQRYQAYIDYMQAIGEILSYGTVTLNREEFDNIVWFTNK